MKNLRKHQLIAIGRSIAVLYGALCLVAFASAASRTEKPAPVDAEQFADFMGHEVLDIQDLAEGAEVQRRMFNRITPPGLSWIQPMFPPVAPFDAENFDERFLSELLGEEKNSVAIYPLSLIQNPKTRETLIYNAEGELIAAIPADRGSREWPADADPSRVILQLGLLPAEDVEPYLYTERRIEETLARYNASRLAKSGGAATRGLETGEFGFADMQILSNGNVQITVTNGADVVEVFAYTVWHTSSVSVVVWTNENDEVITSTNIHWHQVSPAFNGLESAWECLTTNLVLTNGVGVYENANISSNARIRFYAVANRQDTDGDGLTDGAEIFVHHTNPGNPDTDGDGWSDAEELAAGTEPLDRFSATKLARDVVLNEVLYNATGPDLGYEWIELYCAGRYPVNLGNFVIQVADTAYSNAYVFPSNTWIEPGRFLLLGGSNVPNRDLEVNFRMPNRFTNDPTAAVRLVAETGTNTVVVDCLMYGGSASNFNPYGLDTTGWISSHALSAGAGRSLYRRFNGHDTDQVWDWWYTENPTPNPFADISDSDGDGLTDAEELTGSRNPYGEPTNPHNADSDGDGLSDYAECITHGTNPNTWATDDDIYPWPPPSGAVSDWWGSDSYEIANGWDPLNPDENTNGIPDSWEMAFPGTNLYGHADNDGISNFDELMQNSNPNDPDSYTAQPYVIRYESSMPGWANDGMKDIGLRGWVKIHFEDLKTNLDLCVWVQEGRTQEQFRVEWRGATQKGIHWLGDQEVVTSASAEANTQPYLFVQDAGQRPDFTGKLGGEYKIGVLSVGITAYRPTTELPAYGNPFQRYEVPDDLEESPGAGIRVNGDIESSSNENDLIEVQLNIAPFPIPSSLTCVLKRNNSNIKVWDTQTMGTALLGSNHETNLNFSSHSKTVWVECPTGGVADLTFEARTTNGTVICSDKVHFYPFSSIITVFGGRTQVPNDPPDANEGVFLVALDLYTNGFDVHAYDEKTLATDGSGIAYTEVTNAIATRGVSSVGVFGYSYGGDATHDLSRRLDENRAKIGAFTIAYSAYVDAIARPFWASQTGRPQGAVYHANYYQTRDTPHGGPTDPPGANLSVNVQTNWDPLVTHAHGLSDPPPDHSIDNNANVMSGLKSLFMLMPY